jgi:hypothetical protein
VEIERLLRTGLLLRMNLLLHDVRDTVKKGLDFRLYVFVYYRSGGKGRPWSQRRMPKFNMAA